MLADDLHAEADLNLNGVFGDLTNVFVHVEFGPISFDASAILDLVGNVLPPEVSGVLDAVGGIATQLGTSIGGVSFGGELPDLIGQLTSTLGSITTVFPSVDVDAAIGLDALSGRIGAVTAALDGGPLAALLGLVPNLAFPDTVSRVGGSLGGLIDLVRVLAGLTATSAVTQRLVDRSARAGRGARPPRSGGRGDVLARHCADTGLVAALRRAEPDDAGTVDLLVGRVVAFLDAVFAVRDRWSVGLGFGEASLRGLDLVPATAGLELARLSLSGVDLSSVGAMVTELRDLGRPFLDLELPIAEGATSVIDQALDLVGDLTTTVQGFDASSVVAPIQRLADMALGPLDQVTLAIQGVADGAASAIRTVRQIVDEVDLSAVADSLQVVLQPVIDTLDAIESAVGDAQETLEDVAGGITETLGDVADAVAVAAGTVRDALEAVSIFLGGLDLDGLAERVGSGLRAVSAALASAQLTPYFDTAIDVIDTGADVIDAVPFEMLPTDVQQEIVDVCEPVRTLDLQPIEDTLREELAEIRGAFQEDALDDIAAAYAEVVGFLAELDPQAALAELEAEPMQALRDALDAVDPEAILAPVSEALDEFRSVLAGFDLSEQVLAPLEGVFEPLVGALAGLDPRGLLAPITAEIDRVRELVAGVLQLDTISAGLASFRERAVEVLGRIDPAALAGALGDSVTAELAKLPAGPPGGPFGSLLVTLGQAAGLDATEPAVADTIAWVGGRRDGSTETRTRLQLVATNVGTTRDAVRVLDPGPLSAAAQAQHRAIVAAIAGHGVETRLRRALDPMLERVSPSAVLGPLVENRRRYLGELDVSVTATAALAASGRSEVSTAAAELRAALIPLDAFPAKVRSLLGALGIEGADAPLREMLGHLLDLGGPGRLVPALSGLVGAIRDQVIAMLDAAMAPANDAVATIQGILDAFDLGPIEDELVALHQAVTEDVAALSPAALLGPVLEEADQVIARLAGFDPLAPVREVIDAARAAAESVLESARPTVVFAPVVDIHQQVVGLAAGLDVASLLRPVLEALDSLAGQLDDGFDRTIDALQRLQAALPSEVVESPLGGSISGSIDVGFG